jgi:hypothetical protein
MRPPMTSIAALILSATWLAAVPTASAQTQLQDHSSTANISDQKLDAAAAAIEQVAGLRQGYQERMAAAGPSEQQRIAVETTAAVRKAVSDQGLSLAEYNQILDTAQKDPAVREQLVQRMHVPKQ